MLVQARPKLWIKVDSSMYPKAKFLCPADNILDGQQYNIKYYISEAKPISVSNLKLRLHYQFAFPMRRQITIDPHDIFMSSKFNVKTKF